LTLGLSLRLVTTGCCARAPRSCSSSRIRVTRSGSGASNATPYVKDAFHEYLIAGRGEAVNPAKVGTKAAAHYVLDVPAGGSTTVRLRLAAARRDDAFGGFERQMIVDVAHALA
jgi:hypothetical protein